MTTTFNAKVSKFKKNKFTNLLNKVRETAGTLGEGAYMVPPPLDRGGLHFFPSGNFYIFSFTGGLYD